MKLSKEQRRKAIAMVGERCAAFDKDIEVHISYRDEFVEVLNVGGYNDSGALQSVIGQMDEMVRDMRILIRKQQLVLSLAQKPRTATKIDRLLREFFQSRKSFAEKWSQIEARIESVMGALRAQDD